MTTYFYTLFFGNGENKISFSCSNPISKGEYILFGEKYLVVIGVSHKVEKVYREHRIKTTYLHVEEMR